MIKKIFNRFQTPLVTVVMLIALGFTAFAQSTAPASATAVQTPNPVQPAAAKRTRPPRAPRRATTRPARVVVIADQDAVAPQVVTIIHRLSGVKMLRLLLRQAGERGTVATIDPQAITNDAHASIIAGWALDGGKTIAARLPQAAAETEFAEFPLSPLELESLGTLRSLPPAVAPHTGSDLTVITRDGRRLTARYVGLDGETGLSVLQVSGAATTSSAELSARKISEGQRVELFAPEPATPSGEASPGIIYVRIGKVDARIAKVARAKSGKLDQLTVRGTRLSPVVIGGVACDESGDTLGIIDEVEGNNARIVPAEAVRAAARRVLERQRSVPRPLLGVRGEPVEFASRALFLAHGWSEGQSNEVIQKQLGILLTSVLPGTPAALSKLRPGDVIVQVNKGDVKSAEEFSALLGQAGSGEQVQFTVERPGFPAPVTVGVTLGGSFEPLFNWHFEMPVVTTAPGGLQRLGIETMALSAKAASQLGVQSGLLVVTVQPESAAARGGMREGDVIESIDGRAVGRGSWVFAFSFSRQKKHVVSLVRDGEKKQVVLETVE